MGLVDFEHIAAYVARSSMRANLRKIRRMYIHVRGQVPGPPQAVTAPSTSIGTGPTPAGARLFGTRTAPAWTTAGRTCESRAAPKVHLVTDADIEAGELEYEINERFKIVFPKGG